jgi:hypothetical protein
MRKKLDKCEIQILLNKGLKCPQIAEKYGVNVKTVYRFCQKNSIDYKKKLNITALEIKELVDGGMLLSEICEELNCTRYQLYGIYKDAGFNFQNHKAQRIKQSEFMRNNNPVRGPRPKYVMDAMMKGYKEAKRKAREEKLRTGITYEEYARYARYDSYVKLEGKYNPRTHEIDHIFSIKDCWDNHVPLELVSHDNNLQILTIEENKLKHGSSDITLDEFLNNVGVQRLSKSQLSWKKVE